MDLTEIILALATSELLKLNETVVKSHLFTLLIIVVGLGCEEVTPNKNEYSCSVDLYFAAANVK
jgi:hypothetical protein